MKPINARLAYVTSLVELIKEHQLNYNRFRSWRTPQLSIHGKDQNIKVRFHVANLVVGELVLHDPKTDPEVDCFSVRGTILEQTQDWSTKVMEMKFREYCEVRDYWACIDILYMLGLQSFVIQGIASTREKILAGGRLVSPSGVDHGRFSFEFDVTTAHNYWRHKGAPDPRAMIGMEAKGGSWVMSAEKPDESEEAGKQALQEFAEGILPKIPLDPAADLTKIDIGTPSQEELDKAVRLSDSRAELEKVDQGYSELVDNEEMQSDMAAVVDNMPPHKDHFDGCMAMCDDTSLTFTVNKGDLEPNLDNIVDLRGEDDDDDSDLEEIARARLAQIDSGETQLVSLEEMERRFGIGSDPVFPPIVTKEQVSLRGANTGIQQFDEVAFYKEGEEPKAVE